MAFELPALPNFNTNIPQQIAAQPSPMEQYGKMLQLRALSGQVQQQQQMQPLQLQEAQNQTQLGTIQVQKAQQEQQSRAALLKLMTNGDFQQQFGGTQSSDSGSALGFDPGKLLQSLAKGGVTDPDIANGFIDTMLKRTQSYAEIAKTNAQATEAQTNIRTKGLEELHKRVAGAIDDPTTVPALLNDLTKNPQLFTGVPQDDLAHVYSAAKSGDPAGMKAAAGALDIDKTLADFHKSKAEDLKAQLGVAPPTADQVSIFTTKTLPAFAAMRPEQKQAFTAEAGTARTVDEFNRVVDRADATDKAEQMHRDSLAQTEALKGQTFAQAGLKENDKTWTDPQHGYLQTLTQANLGKAAIKAGADGNGLLTSLEPTMVALGVSSFAGVHRVPPAEAQAAGAPGGWAERFNAWATKAATGKLSDQLASEGKELFDSMIDAKYQGSVQASAMHAAGYNIPTNKMPVMDRDGNVTTLDKAPKVKPAEQTQTPQFTVGQSVWSKKENKNVTITAVYPDGSYDAH